MEAQDRATGLALQLLLDALRERTGREAEVAAPERVAETDAWVAQGAIGGRTLTLGALFVVPPAGEGSWYAAKASLEDRLSGSLPGGHILWTPAGAGLPVREPGRSELILRVEELAKQLVSGGHGEVRFPIALYLRKSDEEGGYLTARGGLAPHWARFTGRVFGHYQLDSTELHRPPSGDAYLNTLIDSIALTANALKLGETTTIEAEDAWTMQRLRGGAGFVIVGEPPGVELSSGAALRRSLRRTLQALRPALTATPADARVLGLIGPYASFEDQPVAPALLGMDPTLFAGLDLVLLAADGEVGPVLDLTRTPALAGGT